MLRGFGELCTKLAAAAFVFGVLSLQAAPAHAQQTVTFSAGGYNFVETISPTFTTYTYTATNGTCTYTGSGAVGTTPALPAGGCPTTTTTTPTTTTTTLPTGVSQSLFEISSLGHISQGTSQVSIDAIHALTTDLQDRLYANRARGGAGSNSFAWDPFNEKTEDPNGPFASLALGYAKAPPMYSKAPPVLPSAVQFAIWGQGFADQEKRTETFLGADVGRTTNTYGGLAGFDAAFTNFLGFGGTFVIGAVGGDTVANVRNNDGSTARVSGPGVGVYTVYQKGGFSTDSISKVDFFDLTRSAPATANLLLSLQNWTSAYNINYRFDVGNVWVEPTAGISYTHTTWDSSSKALGFQDGETFRVQAGSRFGTSSMWGNVKVEESITGLAYSDVTVNGGSLAVAVGTPLVPTDEGKVFGQGIGKLNFLWTPQLSSYVEGEVRGRDGVLGYAGRLGARYSFN